MKLAILIVIFAVLGGWYCYDKYGAELFPASEESAYVDPRLEALEKRAKELFPTREKDRARWLADQKSAMAKIDQRRKGVPASMGDEIRVMAAKKFPNDYDKQYEFVSKQETAAIAIRDAIRGFELSKDESKTIINSVARIYSGDYAAQVSSIMRLGDAFNAVKDKWRDVPQSDYNLILKNTLGKMHENPDEAIRYFDRQFLARHNYIMKKFPPEFGDLRAGIQETFPGDFCAQLDELNARLDAAIRRGKKPEEYDGGEKKMEDFFYKNVFIKQVGDQSYCTYFLEIDGQKIVLFPAEMLEVIDGKFTMDFADISFESDKIYVSPDSMFAFAIVGKDIPVNPVEFPKASEIPESLEGKRIAIIGANKEGSKRTIYPVMRKGGFSLGAADYSKAANFGTGGAMIVDMRAQKLLGLLEIAPSRGIEFYKQTDMSYISTSPFQMPGSEKIIKSVEKIVREDMPARARLAPIDIDHLRKWRKFDKAEYDRQRDFVLRKCLMNYWIMRFVRTNTFMDALGSDIVSKIAEQYRRAFFDGPRIHKSLFFRKYSEYFKLVVNHIKAANRGAARATIKEPYYRYAAAAAAQAEVNAEITKYFTDFVVANSVMEGFIHVDLKAKLDGESYTPKYVIPKEEMQEYLGM